MSKSAEWLYHDLRRRARTGGEILLQGLFHLGRIVLSVDVVIVANLKRRSKTDLVGEGTSYVRTWNRGGWYVVKFNFLIFVVAFVVHSGLIFRYMTER